MEKKSSMKNLGSNHALVKRLALVCAGLSSQSLNSLYFKSLLPLRFVAPYVGISCLRGFWQW
jgi:hypothetical protein